jgi:hypothetical protein
LMDIEQYFAAVRRLDLHPTKVAYVHVHAPSHEMIYVQDPTDLTAEERNDVIQRLTLKVRGFA